MTKIPAKFLKAVTQDQVRAAMEADGHDYDAVIAIAFDDAEPTDYAYSTADDARAELAHYRNEIAKAAYYDAA